MQSVPGTNHKILRLVSLLLGFALLPLMPTAADSIAQPVEQGAPDRNTSDLLDILLKIKTASNTLHAQEEELNTLHQSTLKAAEEVGRQKEKRDAAMMAVNELQASQDGIKTKLPLDTAAYDKQKLELTKGICPLDSRTQSDIMMEEKLKDADKALKAHAKNKHSGARLKWKVPDAMEMETLLKPLKGEMDSDNTNIAALDKKIQTKNTMIAQRNTDVANAQKNLDMLSKREMALPTQKETTNNTLHALLTPQLPEALKAYRTKSDADLIRFFTDQADTLQQQNEAYSKACAESPSTQWEAHYQTWSQQQKEALQKRQQQIEQWRQEHQHLASQVQQTLTEVTQLNPAVTVPPFKQYFNPLEDYPTLDKPVLPLMELLTRIQADPPAQDIEKKFLLMALEEPGVFPEKPQQPNPFMPNPTAKDNELAEQAIILMTLGRHRDSSDCALALAKKHPLDYRPKLYIVVASYRLNLYDEAREFIRTSRIALERMPKPKDPPSSLRIHTWINLLEQSLQEKQNRNILLKQASEYRKNRQFDLALGLYQQMWQDLPFNPEIGLELAATLEQKGDRKASARIYRQLISTTLNPDTMRKCLPYLSAQD